MIFQLAMASVIILVDVMTPALHRAYDPNQLGSKVMSLYAWCQFSGCPKIFGTNTKNCSTIGASLRACDYCAIRSMTALNCEIQVLTGPIFNLSDRIAKTRQMTCAMSLLIET